MALLETAPTHLPGTLAWTSPAVAKILRRWNFKEGSGLGARGQGMVAPIQPAAQPAHHPTAGIGSYDGQEAYANGLSLPKATTPSPVVQDESRRRRNERSRALGLEEECCDKILAVLRAMTTEQGAETAAAIVESRKVFKLGMEQRTPGMWKATLPASTMRYIVEQVIKPAMAAEAQEWQPAWDPDCHHWLRPWIPLIGHLPESLYDAVESKIIARADDFDYYNVVSPWKEYMDPKQWDTFTRRHVMPMVSRLVRELTITPPKQMDHSFRTVMQWWAPLVPTEDMVSILEEELFFDRYEDALRHWLHTAAKPSMAEAVAWCVGWKNLFTPELLAQERVLTRLDAVVALVDREEEPSVGHDGQASEALLVEHCMHRLQSVL